LIENLQVDAYGSKMPLFQVATIGAPEPRLLTLSVWDKGLVDAVVVAIKNSDLGVNPQVEATLIRLNLPMMTEERRKELTKVVGKYAEETRIVLRNTRRDFLDALKKRETEEKLPEGVVKSEEEKIDLEIKKFNELVEQISETKQKELMQI
jgi:ribosome recycling factor